MREDKKRAKLVAKLEDADKVSCDAYKVFRDADKARDDAAKVSCDAYRAVLAAEIALHDYDNNK